MASGLAHVIRNRVRTTTTSHTTQECPFFLLCHLHRDDGQLAALSCCSATTVATTACLGEAWAAVDRHGSGSCTPPYSTIVLDRRGKMWSCSRTPLHGDRTPAPGPGRRWSTSSTTLHGNRSLHLRGSGQASSLSLGRRRVTAPCRVTPLVVVPSLAGGDGIDSTTVSFFVRVALKQQEEEKGRRRSGRKPRRRRGRSVVFLSGSSRFPTLRGGAASSSPMLWFRTSPSPRTLGLLACTNL